MLQVLMQQRSRRVLGLTDAAASISSATSGGRCGCRFSAMFLPRVSAILPDSASGAASGCVSLLEVPRSSSLALRPRTPQRPVYPLRHSALCGSASALRQAQALPRCTTSSVLCAKSSAARRPVAEGTCGRLQGLGRIVTITLSRFAQVPVRQRRRPIGTIKKQPQPRPHETPHPIRIPPINPLLTYYDAPVFVPVRAALAGLAALDDHGS